MPFENTEIPQYAGLTFFGVMPVFFSDDRTGERISFPVFLYVDDASGELVTVAEDRYEPLLDRLIASGAFAGEPLL
ncbi:hypothetical protein [Euryhalocaulis caribicus]|uniref:hypothetical protein n=1 Tax=Euryhalocaulis caribicus TaxID=1161401 RepID=UPI0003A6B2C6|nr:hypothetical protein [Euryhalocaulis caribicus]